MAKEMKYLIVHCTATREGQDFNENHIERWHKGARDNKDGTVTFNGKTYSSREDLPTGFVGGVEIKKSRGQGWSKVGYSDLILLDGSRHKFVEHDRDGLIQYSEMTWGAVGVNAESRHVCYVGGLDKSTGKTKDTINKEQILTLCEIICEVLDYKPDVLIAGHNQFNNKGCPSFWVPRFLEDRATIIVPDANIYKKDPFGYESKLS